MIPVPVKIYGWVNNKKEVGGIVFLEVLHELSLKPIVVVAKRNENESLWKAAKKVKVGSAIEVAGEFKKKSISRRGKEFRPSSLRVLSEPSTKLPVDVTGKTKALLDTKIEYRYLTLRLPRERAIFKVRATLIKAAREFFEREGFLEVHTPKICGAGAEGGATVFSLDYFGNVAYLSQSPQLYKQMLVAGLPKVYEVTPYFRAEKFDTPRHLNESWGIDAEMGFISGMEDVMKLLENLIAYVVDYVLKECEEEMSLLSSNPPKPRVPFKRIKYSEVIEMLKSKGLEIEWGEDLGTTEEAKLGEVMRQRGHDFYFITEYPWEAKPFYIMRDGDLSRSFDLDCRGMELASGGQREHRYDKLVENIKDKGLNPDDFKFYLEAFKHGMPPHGGFGLGVERLLIKLLGLSNIREVVLFPRDRRRLIP